MLLYDVALWRYWPSSYGFPIIGEVEADSALLAVLSLMATYRLKHVAYAVVQCPDHTYQRWEQGVSLATETESEVAYEYEES